jgi:hypothetical protein
MGCNFLTVFLSQVVVTNDDLKRQLREIFSFWFFQESIPREPLSHILTFFSYKFSSGLKETVLQCESCSAGLDTAQKFIQTVIRHHGHAFLQRGQIPCEKFACRGLTTRLMNHIIFWKKIGGLSDTC